MFNKSKLANLKKQLWRTLGPYDVFLVDGDYIRENLSDDFTNFALHTKEYPYIPENEFWIDYHGDVNEYPFYLANLWEQKKALDEGLTDDEAFNKGDAKEKLVRAKWDHAAGLKKLPKDKLNNLIRGQRIAVLDNGIQIFWCNGRIIRDVYLDLFTEAGHDLVYKWIEPKQVWVDNGAFLNTTPEHKINDVHIVCVHELWERHLMETQKMPYLEAHNKANVVEAYVRKNPQELKKVLGTLGWHI